MARAKSTKAAIEPIPDPEWEAAEPVVVPNEILAGVRRICGALRDVQHNESADRPHWRIRDRTFLTARTRLIAGEPVTRLQFRSPDPELSAVINSGPPFARAGWGRNVVNMFLGSTADWAEVAELVTESYCVLAPKRLGLLAREMMLARQRA